MANKESRFYTVMVVGDNPEELMAKYDCSLKVKPYIKFKYLDAEKMRKNAIKVFTELCANPRKFSLNEFQTDYFKERLKATNNMTSFEYYTAITNGLYYDDNGNALSEENPEGKWDSYHIGRNFSYPLKLKDGKESYQTSAGVVDWGQMHMSTNAVRYFEAVWSLVVDDNKPADEDEEKLKKEWETRKNYLSNFKDKDSFVAHNCAYWCYAYLDEKGWVDADDSNNTNEWISHFFERFIEPLNDDAKITIYEFSRKG